MAGRVDGHHAGHLGRASLRWTGRAGSIARNGSRPARWDRRSRLAGERNTKHEQLIKLITSMVRPYSWDGMGGPGKIEYFDIGIALVVNQTADVIQEVADLLEALRRLQDLAIAVEVRIISLSETWFERMGVDFSMNIKTEHDEVRAGPQHAPGRQFRPDAVRQRHQHQGP